MSIRSALGAAVVVGVVLGPAAPLWAAPGDYVGNPTAPPASPPAAAPPAGAGQAGTSPAAIPAGVPVGVSDYAGIGQTYAGIVAAAAGTAPTYAGAGPDNVTGAEVRPLGAEQADATVGRAQPASATRFPVTSGDLAGLVGIGLVALGVAGSLRRRTP